MRRARIKATVTVPTRRKTTQDSSATEVNVTESTEENRNVSNDICVTLKQNSGNDLIEEKQTQENSAIEEETQNEQVHPNNQSINCKDESKQNFEVPQQKEVAQPLETPNITQNGKITEFLL